MVNLKLMTVVMIVVLQVCTANPISNSTKGNEVEDEYFAPIVEHIHDPVKPFTEDELERAKRVGISRRALNSVTSLGFTFEEIMKLNELVHAKSEILGKWSFEDLSKMCQILVPGHKTVSNYTSAQEAELHNLMGLQIFIPFKEQVLFVRTSVCDFASKPQSFHPKIVPHTKISFLKRAAENASILDRVLLAKEMCCIDAGGKILDEPEVNGLLDEDMKEFEQHWIGFDTTNVPDSIKKLCDFLHARNSEGQCQQNVPVIYNQII